METNFKEPSLEICKLVFKDEKEKLERYLQDKMNFVLYKKFIENSVLDEKDISYIQKRSEEYEKSLILQKNDADESAVAEINKRLAEFYAQTFQEEKLDCIKGSLELGTELDIILCEIRMAIILSNRKKLRIKLEQGQQYYEKCNWNQKNQLNVYYGFCSILKAEFAKGEKLLSECLVSFDSSEILTVKNLIFYLVFSSLLSLSNKELKKMVKNSEIQKYKEYLGLTYSLINSEYSEYLKKLMEFIVLIKNDVFIEPFAENFCKEMKIKAYKQFLSSYQCLRIETMANCFGITSESLEDDLRIFIAEKRINFMIDKIEMTLNVQPEMLSVNVSNLDEVVLKSIRKYIE